MSKSQQDLEGLVALLIAALKRDDGVQETISEESLCALVAGDVDAKERLRLHEILASSPEAYAHWVKMLELSAQMKMQAAAKHSAQRVSMIEKINHFFRSPWLTLVPVAALVLVVMWPASIRTQTDGLFNDNFPEALGIEKEEYQLRGQPDLQAGLDKALDQQWVEWGVYEGLLRMGSPDLITGLAPYALPQQAPAEIDGFQALEIVGKLTAFIYWECNEQQRLPVLQQAVTIMQDTKSKVPPTWRYQFAEHEPSVQQVCNRNKEIINLLVIN